MATKKAGATAKKKTTTTKVRSTTAKPSTTTKVTTVNATASTAPVATAAASRTSSTRFSNKTFIASALIGEFIGTFLLTVAFMGTKGDPLYLGFAIAGVVLAVGAISGAHVNPAVTVGAWVTRKITTFRAIGYIVAQILGATLAFTILNLFLNSVAQLDAQSAAMSGQTAPTLFKVAQLTGKNEWTVFFIELIAASIFTFAVASSRKLVNDRLASAFTVGLGLLLAGVFGTIAAGYVSANTIFNPAIAFAVQSVDWSSSSKLLEVAAYFIAPLIGGVIGFGLRDVLSVAEKKA